jgi:hypothetical protein
MSFVIYSKTGSDLTYSREAENFSRMMRKGVFSGMQVYRGSSGLDLSINAGYFSIGGRLIREETVQSNVLTIPSPTGEEHNLVWVDFANPLVPLYKIKGGGGFGTPVELSPAESATGLILANIFVPTGATNSSQCVIANVDYENINTKSPNLYWNADTIRVSKGTGVYRTIVTWDNLVVVGITPNDPNRKSIQKYVDNSTSPRTSAESGQRYAIIIARSNKEWSDPDEPITLEIVYSDSDPELGSSWYNMDLSGNDDGSFVASSSKDSFPYRPNLAGIVIIAIHNRDTDAVVYCGVGTAPGGFGLVNGQMENTVRTLTSSVYGTSTSGNSVNIDSLITNIAVIKSATLDSAYDAMDVSGDGQGRVINVDRLPVEIRHSQYDGEYAMYDNWSSAISIRLDSNEDGSVIRVPKAIDVSTLNPDKGERFLYARKPTRVGNLTCIGGNTTLINAGSRVTMVSIGSIVPADFMAQYRLIGSKIAEERFTLEIAENLSGRPSGNVFKLGIDYEDDVFFLISEDTGTNVTPADLGAISYPKVCTGNVTMWESHCDMGFEFSRIRNLRVSGEISGNAGNLARASTVQSSLAKVVQASNVMLNEDSAIINSSAGLGVISELASSATHGGYSGNRRVYSDGFVVITASFTSGNPIEVKAWTHEGGLLGTFSTLFNATSNNVGNIACIRNRDFTIIAVPTGRRVEFHRLDSINSRIDYLGAVHYGDGATDEARIAVPVTKDRFWIGGSHSSFTGNHNVELHSSDSLTVIDIYRVGKNSLSSVGGGGVAFNGKTMAVLAIHSSTPGISTVECLNLNKDGSIARISSGSFEATKTTFFKNDWNDTLSVPLRVAITDSDLVVLGGDGTVARWLERHPIYTSMSRLDSTPAIVDVTATKILELIVQPGFTINTLVFAGMDDGRIAILGMEVPSGPGSAEYAAAYVIDPKSMEIVWGTTWSSILYDMVMPVAAGGSDGISIVFLNDPTSSGSASIDRLDLVIGPCVGYVPSRNSLMKRSLVYGK